MNEPKQFLADFRRYSGMIRTSLGSPGHFNQESEDANSVQVERGITYPLSLINPDKLQNSDTDRLIEIAASPRLPEMVVVDRSGHHRPVYRSLLIYCWLRAFDLIYEQLSRSEFGRWEEGIRPWCDLLEAELGEIPWPAGPMPAGRGASATESAWTALALHVAGKIYVRDAWKDLASDTFGKITRAQNDNGAFLLAGASDNPETHWFHELVILHAAASYAVQTEDSSVAAALARATEFHQKETQPDHATTQPWGLFAFIWNRQTQSLADQILHNAATQESPITLMLLADALYCLELFLK